MSDSSIQTTIDQLIEYIDKAVQKNSVTNVQVAAIFDFLNEKLKNAALVTEENVFKSLITFLSGIKFSDDVKIYKDDKDYWHFDTDYINVKKKFTFYEVEVMKTSHIGGKLMDTIANMVIYKIEEPTDTLIPCYRCYMRNTDSDGRTINNSFAADDLAYCETFNLSSGNHFYWRRVTAVGDDYIDLSKSTSDAAADSDAPLVGDDVEQLGNTTDTSRQGAIIIACTGTGAPYIRVHNGINSFTLPSPIIDLNPTSSQIKAKFINEAGENLDEKLSSAITDLNNVKAQTDKYYTIWFGTVIPSSTVDPESEWTTDALKLSHLDDWYYNKSTDGTGGKAYRYEQDSSGSYIWNNITDADTIAALEAASKAKAAADGKIRNFTSQPTDADAYDLGDLWSGATYKTDDTTYLYKNDLLRCKTAKATGDTFNIEHWEPATATTTATIENLGNEIDLRVKSDELMTQILQKIDQIKIALYGKDADGKPNSLITGINLDESGVQILAKLVTITGDLIASAIQASGLSITDGTTVNCNISKKGIITAVGAILTGTINALAGKIGNLDIMSSGALKGGNAIFNDVSTYSPIFSTSADLISLIPNKISKNTTFVLLPASNSVSGVQIISLPSNAQLSTAGVYSYGFNLTLVAKAYTPYPGGDPVNITYRITSNAKVAVTFEGTTRYAVNGEIHDGNDDVVDYYDLTPGRVLQLYYENGVYHLMSKNF
jgi:hypothetical protein